MQARPWKSISKFVTSFQKRFVNIDRRKITTSMLSGNNRFRSWLPYGFDFGAPDDSRRRLELEQCMRQLFGKAGFEEVIPPAFDFAQTFSLTGSRVARQSFRLRGSQGEDLSLRSDLTVQVIKAAASGRLGTKPIGRFSYVQPVYHDQPWGVGQRREILQAGVELLGSSQARLSEIMQLARMCCDHAVFVYGDARFLSHISKLFPERDRDRLARLFYNKDREALLGLAKENHLSNTIAEMIAEIPLIFGPGTAVLEKLRKICSPLPELLPIIEESASIPDVVYDFSLVRALSYYSGPVFVAYMQGSHSEIITGGIYDNLHQEFGGKSRAACGFAINLSAILEMKDFKLRSKV